MTSIVDRSTLSLLRSTGWYWAVPLFSLVALISLYVSGENTDLFLLMNREMADAGDSFWSNVTIFGDGVIALMFILPFLHRRPDLVWQFVLTAIFAGVAIYLMKDPSILRPPAVLDPGSFHLIGPALRHVSFPSGHTTTAFLLAGLFCMHQASSRVKIAVLLLAVMAGLSRIACGVHWPLDVLGGAFFGWLAAGAGIWVGKRWQLGLNIWAQRFFAALFTLVAIWSPLYYDNAYPGTSMLQFAITAICLALSIPGQLKLFGLHK
jgi:membrane-associated phospholipid phosphatase